MTWWDWAEYLWAGVHRAKYWRRKKQIEIGTLTPAVGLIHIFSRGHTYEEIIPGETKKQKNYLRVLERTVFNVDTGLEMLPVSTSHIEKACNSWGIR